MIFFNDLKLIAFNTYYITIMALFKFFHLTEKAQIFLLYLILEVTHLSIVELVCFYAMWQFVRWNKKTYCKQISLYLYSKEFLQKWKDFFCPFLGLNELLMHL